MVYRGFDLKNSLNRISTIIADFTVIFAQELFLRISSIIWEHSEYNYSYFSIFPYFPYIPLYISLYPLYILHIFPFIELLGHQTFFHFLLKLRFESEIFFVMQDRFYMPLHVLINTSFFKYMANFVFTSFVNQTWHRKAKRFSISEVT